MSDRNIAIIVGTGFDRLDLHPALDAHGDTPWGQASAAPLHLDAHPNVLILPRHGRPHRLAPHAINYRANLWLLHSMHVDTVVALNTVGGIDAQAVPGDLVVPAQLIDYTWGRESTYSDGQRLYHVDMTEPYDAGVRAALLSAAHPDQRVHDGGVYACTQGPRLETPAEIDRLERDGATVVGMTGMPEAALARELDMGYAALCLVVNPAAGRSSGPIDHDAMRAVMSAGRDAMLDLALRAVRACLD